MPDQARAIAYYFVAGSTHKASIASSVIAVAQFLLPLADEEFGFPPHAGAREVRLIETVPA